VYAMRGSVLVIFVIAILIVAAIAFFRGRR